MLLGQCVSVPIVGTVGKYGFYQIKFQMMCFEKMASITARHHMYGWLLKEGFTDLQLQRHLLFQACLKLQIR